MNIFRNISHTAVDWNKSEEKGYMQATLQINRPEKPALFCFSYGLLMLGTRSFSGLDAPYNDLCTNISYVTISFVW